MGAQAPARADVGSAAPARNPRRLRPPVLETVAGGDPQLTRLDRVDVAVLHALGWLAGQERRIEAADVGVPGVELQGGQFVDDCAVDAQQLFLAANLILVDEGPIEFARAAMEQI